MIKIIVKQNSLFVDEKMYKCAFGKNGFIQSKAEGDNCTPLGGWKLRRVFYRSDKIEKPNTALEVVEISPDMGWSDDRLDTAYNTLITMPYPYSAETMYRDDDVYDVVVELGYNDSPPITGKGSAIFFHIARNGYTGTEGCIAVNLADMLEILSAIDADSIMDIMA